MNADELLIEAGRADVHYWRDLWRYRELFYFLAWRDVLVRYKQMAVGIAWVVLRPLITMVVFTIIFGRLANLPSEGIPYPVLVFAGLLPWQFFANAFSEAGASLIGNTSMISKVYFPRVVIPASAVIASLVDLMPSLGILGGLMLWYGIVPSWRIVTLFFFIVMISLGAMGAGLWVAALNVKYRDFRYLVPFIVQIGLYVSPVGFASTIVPEQWRLLYSLNPMVGAIDGFRWALTGGHAALYWPSVALSAMIVVALFVTGMHYFRNTERTFADFI